MKKTLIIFCGALLFATPVLAQESGGRERRASLFVAPGVVTGYGGETATLHIGGGTETVWPSGIGFGLDAGYLTVADSFDGGVVAISPAVIYEFPLDGRLKPFARGGIAIWANRYGGAAFWNIGGGVDYWFKERMGLRVEVRDSFDVNPRYGILDFMFGLVFKY